MKPKLTKKIILNEIQKNMHAIKGHGVRSIGLFGSYARGSQTRKSGIDILIEFAEGKKTFDNYMDLKFFLEDIFKCKVDLVVIETIKPDLKQDIMEGLLYAQG